MYNNAGHMRKTLTEEKSGLYDAIQVDVKVI